MKNALLLAILFGIASAQAAPLGSAFTVQGRLAQAGQPADGTVDLSVEPFGSVAGGDSLAPVLVLENVPVSDGLFTVDVDFGPGFFVGDTVWLQIGVREGTDNGAFAPLSPRQELTSTPHAQFAQSVAMDAVTGEAIADGSIGGSDIDDAQVQRRLQGSCSPNEVIRSVDADGSIDCTEIWKLGGNDFGNVPVSIGTTTNLDVSNDFSILVANVAAVTYQKKLASIGDGMGAFDVVNILGGTDWSLGPAVSAATIAGGHGNRIEGDFGTVSGGISNVGRGYSVVGGGEDNRADGAWSVIGGGRQNEATALNSTVSGGRQNVASGQGSAVLGGDENTASGFSSAVAGGQDNVAAEAWSFASGFAARSLHQKTFVWSDGGPSGFGHESTAEKQFLIFAENGVGINENAPLADLHVRPRNMLLQATALRDEDIIAEDKDAVLGLYSDATLTYGSAISLGEVDATGALVDKWAIVRETTQGSGDSDLKFTFGTTDNYGSNPTQVTFTESGQAFKADNSASWNTTSDGRIKTGVATVTSALDRIRALRPVTYRFTSEYLARHPEITDETRYSVVAQEYAEVFPEAVTVGDEYLPGAAKSEENRIRQVDLHPAMVTALAAIQELAAEVELQRERIEALEAANQKLRTSR